MDVYPVFNALVTFEGIGSLTIECAPGFQSGDEVKGFDQAS